MDYTLCGLKSPIILMRKEPEQPKLIKSEEKISFELQKSDRNRFRIKAEAGIVRTFWVQHEGEGYSETRDVITVSGFLSAHGSISTKESMALYFDSEEEALAYLVEQRGKFALKCLKQPDEKFTTIPILEKDDTTTNVGSSDTP